MCLFPLKGLLFDIFHSTEQECYVYRKECGKKNRDQDEISNVQYWPHLKADIV